MAINPLIKTPFNALINTSNDRHINKLVAVSINDQSHVAPSVNDRVAFLSSWRGQRQLPKKPVKLSIYNALKLNPTINRSKKSECINEAKLLSQVEWWESTRGINSPKGQQEPISTSNYSPPNQHMNYAASAMRATGLYMDQVGDHQQTTSTSEEVEIPHSSSQKPCAININPSLTKTPNLALSVS